MRGHPGRKGPVQGPDHGQWKLNPQLVTDPRHTQLGGGQQSQKVGLLGDDEARLELAGLLQGLLAAEVETDSHEALDQHLRAEIGDGLTGMPSGGLGKHGFEAEASGQHSHGTRGVHHVCAAALGVE